MPEITPTPYPTLNAWIPYPTATPFVSVVATPAMPGVAEVHVAEFSGDALWSLLIPLVLIGIALIHFRRKLRLV